MRAWREGKGLPVVPTGSVHADRGVPRYFRSKSRAGVARLDESLALYVMPAGEEGRDV